MPRAPRILLVLALALAACGGAGERAPGHSGPVPSPEGQRRIAALEGARLPAAGGAWTLGAFGVVPNPTSGKGPVVLLRREGEELWLPLESDADVRDLEAQVASGAGAAPAAATSAAYRAALEQARGS